MPVRDVSRISIIFDEDEQNDNGTTAPLPVKSSFTLPTYDPATLDADPRKRSIYEMVSQMRDPHNWEEPRTGSTAVKDEHDELC